MPEAFLDQCEDGYDVYVERVNKWAEECELAYYDFNLCKEEVLELEQADFRDSSHLNGTGAKKFTEVFYKVMYGEVDCQLAFYDSYVEKKLQE